MPETGESAFWGYDDLGLFLGAIIPSGLLGALLVRTLHLTSKPGKTLLFQCLLYVTLLAALYTLVSLRYRRPFWRSLGWFMPDTPDLLRCIVNGPLLAIGTALLGAILKAPRIKDPIQGLISGPGSLVVVMLFLIVLGPVFEELVFRGFLFPLLAKSLGAAGGILLTALPFALLHGAQNQWAWQQITLIGLAGVAFGYTRYKTGSTAASTLLHCGFNLMGAVAYAVQWERGIL